MHGVFVYVFVFASCGRAGVFVCVGVCVGVCVDVGVRVCVCS